MRPHIFQGVNSWRWSCVGLDTHGTLHYGDGATPSRAYFAMERSMQQHARGRGRL